MFQSEPYCLSKKARDEVVFQMRNMLDGYREVAFSYVYGAFLETLRFHEINVAVFLKPDADADRHDFSLRLADRLGETTGLPVDVRVLNEAPVTFRFHVLHGLLLADNAPELRADMMETTIARYLDIKPVLHQATMDAFTA